MESEQATRLDTRCPARFRFKKNAKNPDKVTSKIRYANFYKRAVARNEIDAYGLLVKDPQDSNGTFREHRGGPAGEDSPDSGCIDFQIILRSNNFQDVNIMLNSGVGFKKMMPGSI